MPVETALGLSNEPAWLDGYGWLSRSPVGVGGGRWTPAGLLAMVLTDVELSDVGWRTEPQHDPTDRLRDYVTVRDRTCDGPTGARVPASRAELDHDEPWPHGPTAAWNLAARGARTHQHKHHGRTPLRTPTNTLWISPAGQLVEMPRHTTPPPGTDPDPGDTPPTLPDPDELHHLDQLQLTPPNDDDRPVLPRNERDRTDWTWLDGSDPPPL